ncbi:MAG: hypothetical protein KGH57_00235 [Candidatus Micrarchaeota archaeon]|nr:hypothetical protein [Candidatus Micrarchaeota archaeon]
MKLDQQFQNLTNAHNSADSEHGDLVLEPICQNPVKQNDAVDACYGFAYNFTNVTPIENLNGSHVSVIGSYVLDKYHGWMEIHPITSIRLIS